MKRLILALAWILFAVLPPPAARAQPFHGVGVAKQCVGPALVDPQGVGKARIGDTFTCTIEVTNLDEAGHALRLDSVSDTVHHASGDVSSGNLLGTPTVLAVLDDFVDVTHTDVVLPGDGGLPNHQLTDLAEAAGIDCLSDTCPASGDSNFPAFAASFPSALTVIDCIADSECDDHNVCTVDTCVSNFCQHNPGNAGTVCRSAAGVCDVAEQCTGSSAGCPADVKSTAICRSATGICDAPESCTGTSNNCPGDTFLPSGTVCRSSAGVCDVPETCTGTGPGCPADGFAPSSTVCRSAAGVCDLAENCTGSSAACPGNAKQPPGTPCADTDGKTCTTAACDANGNCNQQFQNDCGGGCRITGGGQLRDFGSSDVDHSTFGGQVGAPCGCIGCSDEFGHVQGNWQYDRKGHNGSLHAKDYNSLVCGCDGRLTGQVCDGDGPAPPQAPANMACFSGVADFTPTNGKKTTDVAFRVEVEDRGEPGSNDKYRIRIWIPTGAETAAALSKQVCCTVGAPGIRAPDIDDGSTLAGGNIQIHRETPNSANGTCPVPHGICTQ